MKIPKVVQQFKERVTKEVDGKVASIVLYGSVARGDSTKDSDIDIFILTRGNAYNKKNFQLRNKISNIRTEIDIKNETLTSIVYFPINKFLRRYSFDPFLKNVIKEGRILYDRGLFTKVSRRNLKFGR